MVTCVAPANDKVIGAALLDAMTARMQEDDARRIFAEVSDVSELGAFRELLSRSGEFALEARVADYYADGIDLLIFSRSA